MGLSWVLQTLHPALTRLGLLGAQCAMLCAASFPRIVPTCHIADLLAVMEGEPSMIP